MTETILFAKSSTEGIVYNVRFAFIDGLISVTCDCSAGFMKQFCKHRQAFLSGDGSMLNDPDQHAHMLNVYGAIQTSSLGSRYRQYRDDLAAVEAEKKRLTAKTAAIKKEFARLLENGA